MQKFKVDLQSKVADKFGIAARVARDLSGKSACSAVVSAPIVELDADPVIKQ